MPIVFNKKEGGWGLENPTEEEKENLIDYAIECIRNQLGEQVANKVLHSFMERQVAKAASKNPDATYTTPVVGEA